MQASFYVLSAHKTPDDGAVLDFVCRLIQTVLKKSEQSLVVVDNDNTRLSILDEQLWLFEPTSFIPHQLSVTHAHTTKDADSSHATADNINKTSVSTHQATDQDILSPVLLTDTFPKRFDGIILNLSPTAVPLSDKLAPERILEIITPESNSQQYGRDKYKRYRDLGLTLNHFKL